ncbi:hypothetical protein ACOSQ4_024512 [Xanthoceras sorbifolium]
MDSQVVKEASEKAVCQKIDIQYKADWKEKDTESSYVPIAIQMTDLPYNHVNLTYVDTTGKRRTKVEEAHKTSRKYIADKALQGAALEIWMLIPKQNMLISQEDIKKERKKTWKPYKGSMYKFVKRRKNPKTSTGKCFICRKNGHNAKQCRFKKKIPHKILQLIEYLHLSYDFFKRSVNPSNALMCASLVLALLSVASPSLVVSGPMLAASRLVIVGTVVRRLASCHHRSRLLLPHVSSSQVLSFVTSRLAVALLLSLSTSTQYLC